MISAKRLSTSDAGPAWLAQATASSLRRSAAPGGVSWVALATGCVMAAATAAEDSAVEAAPVPASAASSPQQAPPAVEPAAAPPDKRSLPDVEGAIGLVFNYGPEIAGAVRRGTSVSQIGYLRYKRFTISRGGGAFVNRRADDLASGLGLDLVDEEDWRASLSLRIDRGRREEASARLKGLGNVPTTVRLRVGGVWQMHRFWRANLGWTVDAFNRGGGNLAEAGVVYERTLAPRTVYTVSTRLTLAGPRYQQTYYGVTEEQSVASGYPVYKPGIGLRDLSMAVGLRTDLGPHWAAQVGLGVQRLLGPTARSPIVERVNDWGASAGLVWRF